MSSVSILIVSWNSRELLSRCLASLPAAAHQVIVVDNASADGSADLVASEHPGALLVHETTNRGFAAAVNIAAGKATGRYLLLLNPDTQATPGAVERLGHFLDDHPPAAGVAGCLIDEAGVPQRGFNVRRFPSLATWAVDLLLIDKVWPRNPISRRYQALDLGDANLGRAIEVEQPAAACLMLRREVFDTIGGMDERFHPAWFEDVDLCKRLRDAHWHLFWLPDARFHHVGKVAMRALGLREFSQIWYMNLDRYVAAHHGTRTRLLVRLLVCVGMVERILVVGLVGHFREVLAYAAVLRGTLTGWRDRV